MKHDANDVDIAQRTAPGLADDDAERVIKSLKQVMPYWHVWSDPDELKRFTDGMRDTLAGKDTTPAEDSRVRQESPNPQLSREHDDKFWSGTNPEEWRKAHFGKL